MGSCGGRDAIGAPSRHDTVSCPAGREARYPGDHPSDATPTGRSPSALPALPARPIVAARRRASSVNPTVSLYAGPVRRAASPWLSRLSRLAVRSPASPLMILRLRHQCSARARHTRTTSSSSHRERFAAIGKSEEHQHYFTAYILSTGTTPCNLGSKLLAPCRACCASTASIITSAAMVSTIGTARGTTQGSCLPLASSTPST